MVIVHQIPRFIEDYGQANALESHFRPDSYLKREMKALRREPVVRIEIGEHEWRADLEVLEEVMKRLCGPGSVS